MSYLFWFEFSNMHERNVNMKKSPIVGYYGYWVVPTYCSVVSAVIGMIYAIDGNIGAAMICLMVCGVCDMLDGPLARLAKRTDREKTYGIQIDALADIISFGVFPAVIAYGIITNSQAQYSGQFGLIITYAILCAYVLAAHIRLAYFTVIEIELNNRNEKRKYYEGMPVTTVALILPIVYVVCVQFDLPLSAVYNKMLLLISAAFIVKIKIPKLRLRYLVGLCFLIGLPIAIIIMLTKNGVI